jgi:hypothetical protein
MSRTGKIAKLPPALLEELNHQLERGVSGRILVEWLNAHPEVKSVLREFFEGAPVNEQNLCAWRRGGFADWQTRREFYDQLREVAADAGDFEKVAAKMTDHAARLLSTHYAIALSQLPPPRAASSGPADASGPNPYDSLNRLKPLAAITRHVVALRRSDHTAGRMKMEELAIAFAGGMQPAAESIIHPSAVPASPASRIPDRADPEHQPKSSQIKVEKIGPNPVSPKSRIPNHANPHHPPEPQTKSSQIKVENIEPNPASLRFTLHDSPRSTIHAARFAPPASPFPPRLKLTLPPLPHHFLPRAPVSAQVA